MPCHQGATGFNIKNVRVCLSPLSLCLLLLCVCLSLSLSVSRSLSLYTFINLFSIIFCPCSSCLLWFFLSIAVFIDFPSSTYTVYLSLSLVCFTFCLFMSLTAVPFTLSCCHSLCLLISLFFSFSVCLSPFRCILFYTSRFSVLVYVPLFISFSLGLYELEK